MLSDVSVKELRSWCRQKWGKEWWKTEKRERLGAARAALSYQAASTCEPAKARAELPAPSPPAAGAHWLWRAAGEFLDAIGPIGTGSESDSGE